MYRYNHPSSVATTDLPSTPQKNKRNQQTPDSNASHFTRAAVSLEYVSLRHEAHCPLGIYVVPSPESILLWDCILFVHRGYYEGAVLRFRITFPIDYPERIPSVHFITDVFHPLVSSDPDRAFNLAPRFRPWKPHEHNAFAILYYIKSAFKKSVLDSLQEHDCFNKEALRLYREATHTFANLATQSVQLSQTKAARFGRDQSAAIKPAYSLTFSEMTNDQMRSVKQKLGLQNLDERVA